MWRVEIVSRLEEKKNEIICRVPNNYTRQTYFFTECQTITLSKHISLSSAQFCRVFFFQFAECQTLSSVICLVCQVQLFYRVFFLQHSAKSLFAECLMDYTWQTILHSAYLLFPVVTDKLQANLTRQTLSIAVAQAYPLHICQRRGLSLVLESTWLPP